MSYCRRGVNQPWYIYASGRDPELLYLDYAGDILRGITLAEAVTLRNAINDWLGDVLIPGKAEGEEMKERDGSYTKIVPAIDWKEQARKLSRALAEVVTYFQELGHPWKYSEGDRLCVRVLSRHEVNKYKVLKDEAAALLNKDDEEEKK